MAVLGYSTKDSADTSGLSAGGRMYVSKFALAAADTLTELHGWFHSDGFGSSLIRLVIYADTAGAPSTRVAYTSQITMPTAAGDYELSQAGFSVALATGSYWIGWKCDGTAGGGSFAFSGTGGTHAGKISGAADPPDNPFGSTGTSGTRKHSCWAVISGGGGAAAFVPQVAIIN